MAAKQPKSVLVIEPFYGGSHKQLLDLICAHFQFCIDLYSLPATKWPWRARCSALYFSQNIPTNCHYKVLFASSVLNLTELVALRPDLKACKKVIYFHENQLSYPVQWWKERDFQFGYNQIISCLVADVVVFNSIYNKESFLTSINRFLKLMPDYRPRGLQDLIRPKCQVLYYPIDFSSFALTDRKCSLCSLPRDPTNCLDIKTEDKFDNNSHKPLHVVWPHRWEHDKDPDAFFNTMFELQDEELEFQVSVLGKEYSIVPAIFEQAKEKLADKIYHWGYCTDKTDYMKVLSDADVVVSTAQHEFFGVAMLEAAYLGCYPLCPNRLAYPEIFPKECLYNTLVQLRKRLRTFCRRPHLARNNSLKIPIHSFDWATLKASYEKLLEVEHEM